MLLLLVLSATAQELDLTLNEKIAIQNLQDHINHDRIETVAKHIAFPLKRNEYFDYNIESAVEFVNKYHTIFDKSQKQTFSTLDWSYSYVKPVMADEGYFCVLASGFCGNFNDDGLLCLDIIPLSETEISYIQKLIEGEKNELHPSIRDYKEPVCLIHVGRYRIRIDRMHDDSLRYASWKKVAPISSMPDLVISNGEMFGNRWHTTFTFTNAEYTYKLVDALIDGSPVLSITKDDSVILELDTDVNYSFKYFVWY